MSTSYEVKGMDTAAAWFVLRRTKAANPQVHIMHSTIHGLYNYESNCTRNFMLSCEDYARDW